MLWVRLRGFLEAVVSGDGTWARPGITLSLWADRRVGVPAMRRAGGDAGASVSRSRSEPCAWGQLRSLGFQLGEGATYLSAGRSQDALRMSCKTGNLKEDRIRIDDVGRDNVGR